MTDELLSSLANVKHGKNGKPGRDGRDGKPGRDGKDGLSIRGERGYEGKDGKDGHDGRDAYQLALAAGFVGDETDFLASLRGKNGIDGLNGKDGPQGLQGLRGEKGDKGDKGDRGPQGLKGDPGLIGPMPRHQWRGTELRFEQRQGEWGEYVDLKGPSGTGSDWRHGVYGGLKDPVAGAGVSSFLLLTDTPASYTGAAGKVATVKGDESGLEFTTPSAGSGSPGGSDTQVQFNDAGAFGGDARLTFDKTTGTFLVDFTDVYLWQGTEGTTSPSTATSGPGIEFGSTSAGAAMIFKPYTLTEQGRLFVSATSKTEEAGGHFAVEVSADDSAIVRIASHEAGVSRNVILTGAVTTGGDPSFYPENNSVVALGRANFLWKSVNAVAVNATTVNATTVNATDVVLGVPEDISGSLFLYNATTEFAVGITAGASASDVTYTLPTNVGAAGAALTDAAGDGTLSWVVPSGSGDALTSGTLAQFAATTSLELKGVISDETGSGALVFADTPTLVTPVLGVASATTINKVTLTAPATGSTLTIADGATLTVSASATISNGTHSGTNTGDQTTVSGNAGTATALATPRAIYGNNFDGTAALTQVIASTFGGTGNGFAKFTGPLTAEKTFTLPDANATLLYDGGALGTPSSGVATNLTGTAAGLTAGVASAVAVGGITGLGTGVATALAVNVGSAGAPVVNGGALGTPSSGVATNLTGTAAGLTAGVASAVAVGGITGLGTGVATALAVNVGSAGAPVVLNGAGGTPSSLTLTNATGLPAAAVLPGTLATGAYVLSENASIALDPAGSADGKYTGITVTGVSGYAQAFGDLVTLDKDDSRWEAADISVAAAATGDARGILAMVVSAGTDGNACTLLLNGIIRADANFPALTIGAPVYASTTGDVVVAQPTTTDHVIRIVGYALTADEMYFNPGNSWTTHV